MARETTRGAEKMAYPFVPPTIVVFQHTSRLHFGGLWISSAFSNSTEAPYKFHLVLRSFAIDENPSEQQHKNLKPSLEIGLLAVADYRRVTCQGTITVTFAHPTGRLDQYPSSFPFEFSINEPVRSDDQLNKIRTQQSVPAGLITKWSRIPQQCNPFFLEYNYNVPQFRDTTLSLSRISSNIGNQIYVKIDVFEVL